MLWTTFETTFLKEKASKRDMAGHSASGQQLHNVLQESVPLVVVLVPPLSLVAAVSKALTSCYGKVTGAIQKLMSASNHVRFVKGVQHNKA